MSPDPLVTPLATALLECLRVEIAKVDDPPASVCFRPGNVVSLFINGKGLDECCEGLAWVRPVQFYPVTTGSFPEQAATPLPSGEVLSWAVELEMGVARCAPTGGPHAGNPSCDDWTATTLAVNDDAAAMRRAYCCFNESRKGKVMPLVWSPIPVEGGCTGGTMNLIVRGPRCEC